MPVYSFKQAPVEVRELLARFRIERRDPVEVRKELARLGIGPALQMMYLRGGLGLSLEQAKRVVTTGDELDNAGLEEISRATSERMTDDAEVK